MIGNGAPIARPVIRDPGRFHTHFMRAPRVVSANSPAVRSATITTGNRPVCRPHGEHVRLVEYRVRAAQITDIEALVALSGDRLGDGASGGLGAADILRQLVFLPHATVLVAERRRTVIGGAVLAIRPSVRSGGYVGTIDLLVVDPA